MPSQTQYRYSLHNQAERQPDGSYLAVLWPDHKPLSEVLELRDTTPCPIFEATYQGNPTAPGGSCFHREWFKDNRFDAGSKAHVNTCIARYISWDTAEKTADTNAYTAAVVGELWPDYRLAIRFVWRDRLEFPDLPPAIERLGRMYNDDFKLHAILIEDKSSGVAAIQTLARSMDKKVAGLIKRRNPEGDKMARANQAATWCKNGSVILPAPGLACPWLLDFEDEMFTFPGSIFKDQIDAFAQLVIYLENYLSSGWKARNKGIIKV